jgi:hypothetical protein
VKNNLGTDVAKLVRDLREKHHLVIDGGYGKIKGQDLSSLQHGR